MSDRSRARPSAATTEEIEAELRRENPKGRLWERCAQLKIAPPEIRHRKVGDRHQAELSLEIDAWEVTSGIQSGWSRRMVVQLASRELLAELEALLAEEGGAMPNPPTRGAALAGDDEDVWEVGAGDAERLRSTNPKGQVFEWCQKRKPPVARPRFETRKAKGGGVHVRATLVTLHLSSPWFRASQMKLAEQAAAEALLPLLPDEIAEPGRAQLDPRSALSELRQRGVIAGYAFETTSEEGAPHARRFTVVGHLTRPDGAIETSGPLEAPSKKEATLLAARALLDRLSESE